MRPDARLRIRRHAMEIVEVSAARPGDELSYAPAVGAAIRVLLPETFVQMIVRSDHDIHALPMKQVEQIPHHQVVSVLSRREQRMMPHRHRATRLVRQDFCLRERILRRANAYFDVRVQHQHEPVTGSKRIEAFTSRLTEIREIRRGERGHVFVIAWRWSPPPTMDAPRGVEAVEEVAHRPLHVRQVAGENEMTVDAVDQARGLFDCGRTALADITDGYQIDGLGQAGDRTGRRAGRRRPRIVARSCEHQADAGNAARDRSSSHNRLWYQRSVKCDD